MNLRVPVNGKPSRGVPGTNGNVVGSMAARDLSVAALNSPGPMSGWRPDKVRI